MLIHEWQLGPKLSSALQQQQPADFRLWRAMLSTAVEEQAAFVLQQQHKVEPKTPIRQLFGLPALRPLDYQAEDESNFKQLNTALQSDGLVQARLLQQLRQYPWVMKDQAKKLDARVEDNLDAHARRRYQQESMEAVEADATQLYEVLQQLHMPHEPQDAA